MLYLCAVSALALTTPFHARRLSEAPVGKYPPGSDVVDHASECKSPHPSPRGGARACGSVTKLKGCQSRRHRTHAA